MSIKIIPSTIQPKLSDLGSGAFLGDIDVNKDNTLSSGFYEQHSSKEPLNYTYTYDEMKIVLEGELHVKEKSAEETLIAKPGDVLNIANGAELEFNSPNKARIFYVAKRSKLE